MNQNIKKERIDFVLPDRIGDCVMSLPAILSAQRLLAARGQDLRALTPPSLFELIWSLGLFETVILDELVKLSSFLEPALRAYFLDTTSNNLFLQARERIGRYAPQKPFLTYDRSLEALPLEQCQAKLDPSLFGFLHHEKQLSVASIRYFAPLLDLGFSSAQIIEASQFSLSDFQFKASFNNWTPTIAHKSYVVICLEAAYGSAREQKRRWDESLFLALAEKLAERETVVFVGLDPSFALPKHKNFLDLRKKLTILQLSRLLQCAKLFVGNDSGPLHLANLLGTNSVCIYQSTEPSVYGPIFAELNHPSLKPSNWQSVYEIAKPLL